jgi:hypothetical protein
MRSGRLMLVTGFPMSGFALQHLALRMYTLSDSLLPR